MHGRKNMGRLDTIETSYTRHVLKQKITKQTENDRKIIDLVWRNNIDGINTPLVKKAVE